MIKIGFHSAKDVIPTKSSVLLRTLDHTLYKANHINQINFL